MREPATLKLTDGHEVAVEVDRDELDREQIVVHRVEPQRIKTTKDFLAVLDDLRPTLKPHPTGTTDRFIEEDRREAF